MHRSSRRMPCSIWRGVSSARGAGGGGRWLAMRISWERSALLTQSTDSEDWPFYSITLSLQHPRFAERDFMEYQADGSRSLQFDPRKLDHLGPFLSIRGYEFSELVGRHRH